VLYTLQECKWGAYLPSLGRSACRWIYDRSCDFQLVQSQTYDYLPSAEHWCRALPLFLDQNLFPFPLSVGG